LVQPRGTRRALRAGRPSPRAHTAHRRPHLRADCPPPRRGSATAAAAAPASGGASGTRVRAPHNSGQPCAAPAA